MFWEDVPSVGPRDKRCAARMAGFFGGEGVWDVANFFMSFSKKYFDDVEARGHAFDLQLLKPFLRCAYNALLFLPVDGFFGGSVLEG